MTTLSFSFLLTGLVLFFRAWRSLRATSMRHALAWTLGAWMMWLFVMGAGEMQSAGGQLIATYLALSLTACAGIAVLGARQPGVHAWNFVVGGLLAVLLLPIAQTLVAGEDLLLDGPRLLFLLAVLGVGWLNYLPTRLLFATGLLGGGCLMQVACISVFRDDVCRSLTPWSHLLIALAPWAACLHLPRRSGTLVQSDRLWLAFRDRHGSFWGLRVREQFNRSARHAGLAAQLGWFGLTAQHDIPAASDAAAAELLRALLKRFGLAAESSPSYPGHLESGGCTHHARG